MMDSDSDDDLKAAAELALENTNCSLWTVAHVIRSTLGWRGAVQSRDEAIYALKLVGTPRALEIIRQYKETH